MPRAPDITQNIKVNIRVAQTGAKKVGDEYEKLRKDTGWFSRFRGEWLSVMFAGQRLAQITGGMLAPTRELLGIQDMWSGALMELTAPALEEEAERVEELTANLLALDEITGGLVGRSILWGEQIGKTADGLASLVVASWGVGKIWIWLGTKGVWAKIAGWITKIGAGITWLTGLSPLWGAALIAGIAAFFAWVILQPEHFAKTMYETFTKIGEFVYNLLYGTLEAVFNAGAWFVELLVNTWEDGWSGLIESLKSGFQGFIDWAWNIIRPFIEIFTTLFGGVGEFITGGVTVPGLASGGIVTRPTLAMIGEAGPEAVIPLTGGGGMGTYNISLNIENVSSKLNPEEVPQLANELAVMFGDELRRLQTERVTF